MHDRFVADHMPAPDAPEGWRNAEAMCAEFADLVCEFVNESPHYKNTSAEMWDEFRFEVSTYCRNAGETLLQRDWDTPELPQDILQALERTPAEVQAELEALASKELVVDDLSSAALIEIGKTTPAGDIISYLLDLAHEMLAPFESRVYPGKIILGRSLARKGIGVRYASQNEAGAIVAACVHEYIVGTQYRSCLNAHYNGLHAIVLTRGELDQLSNDILRLEWLEAMERLGMSALQTEMGQAWAKSVRAAPYLDSYILDNSPGHLPRTHRWINALVRWLCYLRARRRSGCSRKVPHLRFCAHPNCECPAFLHDPTATAAHREVRPKFYCPLHQGSPGDARVKRLRARRKKL